MLRAIQFVDRADHFRQEYAGSVWFGEGAMLFWCPCGCGALGRIAIGDGFKPVPSPSWEWNGSKTEPTLEPSVKQLDCGWHGYLRDGYWQGC